MKDMGRGRSGDRKDAVGAADLAAADTDRRDDDLLRRKPLHQQADRSNVRNGVHRADLMEMDLRHRDAVDPALCLRDPTVDGQRVGADGLGNRKIRDDAGNVVQAAVVVMAVVCVVVVIVIVVVVVVLMLMLMLVMMLVRVVVQMLVLLRAVHGHGHVRAVFHAGNTEGVQGGEGGLPVRAELQQSGGQHIARRAHAGVKIEGLHGFASM